MKFLYLLGSRLTLYFRKSKALFLFFCFCGVATSLSFLFFYAMLPSVQNRSSDRLSYREFTVTDIFSGLSMEKLTNLQNDPMVERVTVVHTGIEGEKMKIAAALGDRMITCLSGKDSFTEEDTGAGKYSAIVPFDPVKGLRVGEKITIGGKEFDVIGIGSGGGKDVVAYIPLATYLDMGFSTESAVVYAKDKADAESGAMTAKLREVFGGEVKIGEPVSMKESDENSSRTIFQSLSVAYVVVILVFLFLFLQMVEETGRETAIFRTFGATGGKILLLHFCEVMLLTGLSALVGCLLHAALYKPLFSKLNPVDIPYSFSDYAIVFSAIIGITLVVSIPYVIRCLFLSPKEATLTAAN